MRRTIVRATVLSLLLLAATAASSGAASRSHQPGLLGAIPHRGAFHAPQRALAGLGADDVTYHGGWVMRTNTVYAIYWVPGGYSVSSGYESLIDRYLGDVAAASGTTGNVYSVATQYYDTSGNIAYDSRFGGGYVDSAAFPASGCDDGSDPVCLTDGQLQTEIQRVVTQEGWPAGESSLFFVFTPPSVGVCYDGTASECTTSSFCAYHSGFTGDDFEPVVYAVEPYDARILGCKSGSSPNGDDADATINTISHEQNEAITDPWGDGWYDGEGEEIADKCAWTYGTTLGAGLGSQPYNELVDGHGYWLQREWSNEDGGCVQSYARTAAPAELEAPVVSGVAAVGQLLSTTDGGWAGTPTSFGYTWQRCASDGNDCAAISDATAASYRLTSVDAGHTIRSAVTATNSGGSSWLVVSLPTEVVVPVPATTAPPVVSGIAAVGRTLTTTAGTWSTSGSFAYRWLRCTQSGSCTAVAGADSASYRLVRADAGRTLEAQVSATNAAGTTTAVSAATQAVVSTPAARKAPRVAGRATVGRRLTARRGTWAGSPTRYRYQWLRCSAHGGSCVRIRGAVHIRYRVEKRDARHRLRVRIRATNAAGSKTVTSRATRRVPVRHVHRRRRHRR